MIGTIFNNNLKTISRNWNYFLVLVIFPILLILLAGVMLNSANVNNIHVGLINEGETVSLDFSEKIQNIFPHVSVSDCLSMMAHGDRSLCIRVYTLAGKPQMDAYVDATQPIVESYVKQFFLETVLEKQNVGSREGLDDFDTKVAVFSTSFSDARRELDTSYRELDSQSKNLVSYRAQVLVMLSALPDTPASASTKSLLQDINTNVSEAIFKTEVGKAKILELQNVTSSGEKNLFSLRDSVREKGIVYQIKDGFEEAPKNPVSLAFPLLLALIITFTSVVLSNLFVARRTHQSQYIRTLVAPVNDSSFLIADYAVNVFFVFIQVIFALMIGIFFFHIDILMNLPQIALSIFLAASFFIFIGMSFGYFFKSENLSMLLSIFTVILFQIFSDILTPVAFVDPLVSFFVSINPFVILNTLLREVILLHQSFNLLIPEMTKLFVLFLLALGLTIVAKKASKKRILD